MTHRQDNPSGKKKKFSSKYTAKRLKQNGKGIHVDNIRLEDDRQSYQRFLRVMRVLCIHNKNRPKGCYLCGSETTSLDKTKWVPLPHWYRLHIKDRDYPICKTCYVRKNWQKKYVPKNTTCDHCGMDTLTVSKYGTPIRGKINSYPQELDYNSIDTTGEE